MPKGHSKAVVLLSGGLDSSVLLGRVISQQYDATALSILYGQRHAKEVAAAQQIAKHYDVAHEIIRVPSDILAAPGSSQTDMAAKVPEGHYADDNMKQTVVPNRNMFLISIAVARAISMKAQDVFYAAHAGDHAIYPDCRPQFVTAMATAVQRCDWNPPRLDAPFLAWDKRRIVEEGFRLGVPLDKTWTCYNGRLKACGRCGTCVERLEAFALADIIDPLEYEDHDFWKEAIRAR